MDSKEKRYVVAEPETLKKLFPNYTGNDVRSSLDQKLSIYEVNLTAQEIENLERRNDCDCFTHEEILGLLNGPESAGVWYPLPGESESKEETNE
ncbi:MAG: hypothetical protein H3C35_03715 [Bacteroidetes bacterium]|nr:hypothetical protein [Bacteroidota bacterium]